MYEHAFFNEASVTIRRARKISITMDRTDLRGYVNSLIAGRIANSEWNRRLCWTTSRKQQFLLSLFNASANLDVLAHQPDESEATEGALSAMDQSTEPELLLLDGGNRSQALRDFFENKIGVPLALADGAPVEVLYDDGGADGRPVLPKHVRDQVDLSCVIVKKLANCTRAFASQVATSFNRGCARPPAPPGRRPPSRGQRARAST